MIGAASLAGARVVLVEAPLGYGKTTLAEQVIAHRGRGAVRVQPRAGDPAANTLARALRRCGRAAAAAELEAAPDDAVDLFVGSFAGADGSPDLLVDDTQLVAPDHAAALADALRDLPPGTTALVCGRDLGPFVTLRDLPGAALVGAAELGLAEPEIAALLGVPRDDVRVTEVLAATDGWPAAVALTAQRLRRDPTWAIAGAAGARSLLRSLVAELVADDPSLAVLARLPLYDDRVAELAGSARRPPAAPAATQARWRTVPPVVRDLLPEQPPLPADLVLAIARHYRDRAELGAAVDLLGAEADGAAAGAFLAQAHWSELTVIDVASLRAILGQVDPGCFPEAFLAAARAVEATDRGARAEWLAAVRSADGALGRAVAAERARDLLRSAEVDAGAELATAVLAAAGDDEPVTRARALVTLGMRDAYLCTADSLTAAARSFDAAADLYRDAGETALRADTLARLGYTALHYAGRPADGAQAMHQALALLPVGDRTRATWLTCYADVLDVLGRADEARAALREALEIGARLRDAQVLGMAEWTRSWHAAHADDRPATQAAIAAVERYGAGWLTGGQRAEFLGSCAENLTLLGDLVGYHSYLAKTREIADAIGYPAVALIPEAYYEAEHGDPATGLRLLAQLTDHPANVPSDTSSRLLLTAVAHARLGDRAAARDCAGQALAHAAAMGVPDLHHRIHRRQVVALRDVLPADSAPDGHAPSLQLLGRFALTSGGVDRTPPPGHPATLVKLLALRPAMTADEVVELLWPDADPAVGRARLRNTLNRLKERSGAVVVRAGDVLRLDESVRVDATAFAAAASAATAAPPDEQVGRARQALAMYAGDLLPGDVYEDWAAPARARLQRSYVTMADLLAGDCIDRDDLEEAARLLDLGLAVEPLDEARAALLCRVLAEQGRTSAAAEVARRCADALTELGLAPGADLHRFLLPV